MAPRAPTVCTTHGCHELVAIGRCDEHRTTAGLKHYRREQGRERYHQGDPSMTAYTTPQWRNARRKQLRDEPRCQHCGEQATVADHAPVTRRNLVALGVANPDETIHLQSLCVPCHNRKTATVDRKQQRA
jgi:5-methylcytosine-specific restriction protein A